MRIAVEAILIEYCYDTEIFHVTVCHDSIKDDLTVLLHILQFVPRNMLKKLGYGEYGTCCQPARHVVAADMVVHGVIWYLEDVVLKFLEVAYAAYHLTGDRVAKEEISKAEMLCNGITQVNVKLLGVFVEYAYALSF